MHGWVRDGSTCTHNYQISREEVKRLLANLIFIKKFPPLLPPKKIQKNSKKKKKKKKLPMPNSAPDHIQVLNQ
jgi:hypothetical protein